MASPNRTRLVRRVIAVLAVTTLGASCGDDDDDAGGSATTEASTDGTSSTDDVPGASPATTAVGAAAVDPMEATVDVTGDALPLFGGEDDDPAVGRPAPTLSGTNYAGEPVEVGGAGGPTMVVFLAHWCPHCNAEIPVLLEWRDAGMIPEDLDIVGVSTGVQSDAPNYPPDEWLADMGWEWPVLADSPAGGESAGAASDAYGLSAFPFFTVIGEDGTVKLRAAGEKSLEELDELVTEAMG